MSKELTTTKDQLLKNRLRLVFMGTPQFACKTLEKLLQESEFEVVAVYTREPQIAGRGHKLTNSAIHDLALQNGLPVFTPKTLRNPQIQQQFKELRADAAVVLAYGLILPQEILDATKFGCINIHPSLLPRWRGPSPIQYTLFAGDAEIGVTIIKMDAGIDSGDMILQQKFALQEKDNYATLAPTLSELGADMMVEALKKLRDGEAVLTKQDAALATFSKKLEKSESEINWNLPAREILNKIRALSGSLTAYFKLPNGEMIKIYDAEIIDKKSDKKCGEIVDKNFLIQCADNCIRPKTLQRQGKRVMSIDEFLPGFFQN